MKFSDLEGRIKVGADGAALLLRQSSHQQQYSARGQHMNGGYSHGISAVWIRISVQLKDTYLIKKVKINKNDK